MAQTYVGDDLDPSLATDSVGYHVTGGADAGDEFYTHITMDNIPQNYKVGWVTVSTNFSGGYLNARTGTSYGGSSRTGRIKAGEAWTFTVNYTQPRNFIVVNIPQEIRNGFGLTFKFDAQPPSILEASYTVNSTRFIYDGNSHTCVSSVTNATISGTNTASARGSYTALLTADNAVPYADACYFNINGIAYATIDVDWVITDQIDRCVRIMNNGAWQKAIPYVMHNGAWQQAEAYVLENGVWTPTHV